MNATGTSLIAALATARNGIGVEIDPGLVSSGEKPLAEAPDSANAFTRQRLLRHIGFVKQRTNEHGPLKHTNIHYGFPVMTAQERELLLNPVLGCRPDKQGGFTVLYDERPQSVTQCIE